ncbi:MAG: lysophospholipid acyltransferase family protein [Desulfobacterales bacterium]
MKLYRFTVWLLRIFSYLYFIEVRAQHRERIPESGPVILAANHPASVLDAILLAMQTRRQIHFLAKSGLFKNRFIGWLLGKVGVIPVYRSQEAAEHGRSNIEVFSKVYELFERGGCLGLFPEGRNSPPGQVAELRTGAARMALGAEERYNYGLGLKIIPVGLNYEHRGMFTSSALLRFGEPIKVAGYAGLHKEDEAKAVKKLTSDLQEALRQQAMHVEDEQISVLADDLYDAMGYSISPLSPEENKGSADDTKTKSRLKTWIWKILEWYKPDPEEISDPFETRVKNRQRLTNILTRAVAHDPSAVKALRRQVDLYRDHLRQTELSRAAKQSLDNPVRERLIRLRMTLYTLLMAPVALFGLLHNIVPYMLTKYTARLAREEPIRVFAYFGVGFLAFSLAYGTFGFWLWFFAEMNWKWILAYLALLPPAGFAALRYRRNIVRYRDKILVRAFFWNQEELVRLLRRERRDITERLEKLEAELTT